MSNDARNYLRSLYGSVEDTEKVASVSAPSEYSKDFVEKLAAAVEQMVGEPEQGEDEGKDEKAPKEKKGESAKGGGKAMSIQELLRMRMKARSAKSGESKDSDKKDKGDKEEEGEPEETKEASVAQAVELKDRLRDLITEKVAKSNSEESTLIDGILARLSLAPADTRPAAKKDTPVKNVSDDGEVADSVAEDTEGQIGQTVSELIGESKEETKPAVESATSEGTKTAASRVPVDLSAMLKNSILSKASRAGV